MLIGFTLFWTGAITFLFFWPLGAPMMMIGILWFVGAAMNRSANSYRRAGPAPAPGQPNEVRSSAGLKLLLAVAASLLAYVIFLN